LSKWPGKDKEYSDFNALWKVILLQSGQATIGPSLVERFFEDFDALAQLLKPTTSGSGHMGGNKK
jgi:hypothetical protein